MFPNKPELAESYLLCLQANFLTDSTKVACARNVRTITNFEMYRQCVANVTGVRYGRSQV